MVLAALRQYSDTAGQSVRGTGFTASDMTDRDAPMFNPTHRGSTPGPGPENGDTAWTKELDFAVEGLAVDEESLYVAYGPKIAAFTPDGTEQWSYETFDTVYTPAVTAERVYVSSYDEHVHALDADTGEVLWETELDPTAAPAVVDGSVYVAESGTVNALDADTGDIEWQAEMAGKGVQSPAVVEGVVYAGTDMFNQRNHVAALDAETGERLWETSGRVTCAPTVAEGILYTGYKAGTDAYPLHALDTDTGETLWTHEMEGSWTHSPAVVEGTLYANGSAMYAFDPESGEGQWRYDVDGAHTAPAVVDGTVYIGTLDDNVQALAADTGEKRWAYHLGDWVEPTSPPAVAHDYLYVGDDERRLHAIE